MRHVARVHGRGAIAEKTAELQSRVDRGVIAAFKVSHELFDGQLRPTVSNFYVEDLPEAAEVSA